MIDANETLGQLAAERAGATAVFLRHRLDFCCGGRQTLSEACREAAVDLATVVAELDAVPVGEEEAVRWDERPLPELIDHILARYHEPLRRDLPGLVEAARTVERVHRDKPTCPRGLADHLARVQAAVESHLAKEEEILFPALRAGARGPGVQMPVRVMMHEHDAHGLDLRRTRELTADLTAPPEACATWRALYEGLATLEADLMVHIHLENNVLFPAALRC